MADDRPAEERIAADLRAQIIDGLIPPGAQLESIPSTAARLGVSTASVQHALARLRAEGFIVSHRGKGVFARREGMTTVDVAAYYDPASRGITYTLLDVAEVEAPRHVAEALGEERAILRHRRTDRAGEPVELTWSYYPASLAAGTPLAGRARIKGGAPRVLADLGYPQRRFVDRVAVRAPTTEEAEKLGIPRGVPVIRQFRVVYSDGDRPVEVSVIVKSGHRFEVQYAQEIPESERRRPV